jgi:hypothetical protein
MGMMISPSLCEYREAGMLRRLESTPALDNAMGNGHWQSAVFALFDSILAVGLCLGLIPRCRGLLNRESRVGRFLSQHSYAVYVFHIPIVVFLAYALRRIALAPLLNSGWCRSSSSRPASSSPPSSARSPSRRGFFERARVRPLRSVGARRSREDTGQMRNARQRLTLHRPATYEIRVPGEISQRCADWVEGMTIKVEGEGSGPPITTMTVTVDQAALQGLLRRLYSQGMPLVSVTCIECHTEE